MRTKTSVGVSAKTLQILGPNALPRTRLICAPSDKIEVLWRRQYDATHWFIDAFAASPALRWAHTDTAGVDRLPLEEMHRRGVVLSNACGVYTGSVSQWIISAVMLAAKRLDSVIRLSDRQEWRQAPDIFDLTGETMLMVGFGSIGAAVGQIAGALGMRVIGIVRRPRPMRIEDPADVIIAASEDWRSRLSEASFLVVTAPLTAETAGLIGAVELALLPPGAWVINAARGGIVDEAALCEALDRGHLGGAVLDVFGTEPLPKGHPLWGRPNVVISPHVASHGPRASQLALEHFAREMERYQAGLSVNSRVDPVRGY